MNTILLEHTDFSAGATYENSLILGGVGGIFNEMQLHESVEENGTRLTKFRGKFQEAEQVNKNKRIYPEKVLKENVKRLMQTIKEGGLVGEIDHPSDSIVHFTNCSHKITNLWWEGNSLMGEGVILSTPAGKILKALINDGVRIGISSRGVGNGQVNEDGVLVIGESYKLITFDAVADPSTHAAFQEKVVSTKKESVISQQNYIKNETTSIDKTLDKNVLLACVAGIINQIKTRK